MRRWPRSCSPGDRRVFRQRQQKRSPAEGQLRDAHDLYGPDDRRRMLQSAGCRGDDIARSHHAPRQARQHPGFEPCDRVEAGVIRGEVGEVHPRQPSLLQRAGRGHDHARQILDTLKFPERGRGQGLLDRYPEAFVVHRP